MRRDELVKKALISAFFSVVVLSVFFAFAYAEQTGSGGGGGDIVSAGYQMKIAVADPAVGTSQSANYIYNHGTLWFDNASSTGGGGGGGDGGGGGSGSGWFESFIGGISPEVDVSFTDTPAVTEVVRNIPQATTAAARIDDAPARVARAITYPQKAPHIIRLVDETGVTRDLNMVLFKRIVPWPLWVAFALIILGIVLLVVYAAKRGKDKRLLWIAGVLILLGIIIGLIVRYAYRAAPLNMNVISSVTVASVNETNVAVKKLMNDLSIGVHVIETVDTAGKKVLTIKVFITPALPF